MTIDLTNARWHKSSRSGGTGECVEVADNLPEVVAVRDSKDPSGPALAFSRQQWRTFIEAIKSDEFPA